MKSIIFTLLVFAGLGWGFPLNPTLANLADNTARDLGLYTTQCADSSFDADNCRRYGDYSRFTYDPDRHQILFFGGGHSSTMRDDIDVFNFATLTWKSAYHSTQCSEMTSITTNGTWSSTGHPVARHTYDQLIYAPNVGRLIITSPVYGAGYCGTYGGCGEWCGGKMLAYDPVAKTWTAKATGTNGAHVWSSEYDPVSGCIISAGGQGLNTYDPVNDVKATRLSSSPISDYADNLVYFPPNDKFYYFSRGGTIAVHEVTLNRTSWGSSTITAVSGMSGTPGSGETGFAYDTANHVIGGAFAGGKFYAYNPLTKAWTTKTMLGGTPPAAYSHCVEYDPVNNVFIYYGEDFHTWAYRYAKGNWTAGEKKALAGPAIAIEASPNPFKGLMEIHYTGNATGVLNIFSLQGQVVYKKQISDHGAVAWNPGQLGSGVYVLKITAGRNEYSKKLILNR